MLPLPASYLNTQEVRIAGGSDAVGAYRGGVNFGANTSSRFEQCRASIVGEILLLS
jgi:hypothetical protein